MFVYLICISNMSQKSIAYANDLGQMGLTHAEGFELSTLYERLVYSSPNCTNPIKAEEKVVCQIDCLS